MSKIYEALLRAEQERADKDSATATATPAPTPVPAAEADSETVLAFIAEVQPPATPEPVAQAAPEPAIVAAAAPAPAAPEPVAQAPKVAEPIAPQPAAPVPVAPASSAPVPVAAAPAPAIPAPAVPAPAPIVPKPVVTPPVAAAPVVAPPVAAAPAAARPIVPPPTAPAPKPQPSTPVYAAPAAIVPPVPAPAPAPAKAARPVYSSPLAAATAPVEASPARSMQTDDRGFSPDKVRRCVWNPTIETLPAIDDRGPSVEQFRSLRSRMFEFRDLNKLKSILVSSGLPQEGKSFIAANLAISFARHKAARVLLIDGDMRRSTLHKLLGAPGEVGLAEYLAGNAGLLDIMQQMKLPEDDSPARLGLSSLTIIPGGSDVEKAADLSGNPRFAQLMAAVSPFYDWIVVDSPPVNVVADGVNLARACDGVLLVARGGITKYPSAQRALVELKASKILGFVLNAVETMPLTGGYYGYEGYDSPQK